MGLEGRDGAPAREFINAHSSLGVFTHVNPDGDALGSAFALTDLLRRLGKNAVTVLLDKVPDKYDFPEFASLHLRLDDVSSADFDGAISVDCADLARLGHAGALFSSLHSLSIDHHLTNDGFADVNIIENSPATAQMIYDLTLGFGAEPDRTAQAAIYMGIIADTGALAYPSTTPRSFEICARLAALGLDTSRVAERVFNSRSWSATRLIGEYIATIRLCFDGRMALSALTLRQIGECGASVSDTEALINYARDIEGVDIACFLRETKEGSYKLSLRSKSDRYNVADFARLFGGGGHARAAGCLMTGSLEEIEAQIMHVCQDLFE